MKIVIEVPCKECHGRGSPEGDPLRKCRLCGGATLTSRAVLGHARRPEAVKP